MICTIYSAKGLEFKNVILCAYLDDRPPEELEASRRLIYVGMTREGAAGAHGKRKPPVHCGPGAGTRGQLSDSSP